MRDISSGIIIVSIKLLFSLCLTVALTYLLNGIITTDGGHRDGSPVYTLELVSLNLSLYGCVSQARFLSHIYDDKKSSIKLTKSLV